MCDTTLEVTLRFVFKVVNLLQVEIVVTKIRSYTLSKISQIAKKISSVTISSKLPNYQVTIYTAMPG